MNTKRNLRLLVTLAALGASPAVLAAKQGTEVASQAGPMRLRTGQFEGQGHEASGSASVYQLADGRKVLRLEDFRTDNGPDLRVYLVEGDDAGDDSAIKTGRIVDLGALKGNAGNQNYELPADVDLDRFRSVSIWCKRFSVNFAAAPLRAAEGQAGGR
jgi:hypothetical protein